MHLRKKENICLTQELTSGTMEFCFDQRYITQITAIYGIVQIVFICVLLGLRE